MSISVSSNGQPNDPRDGRPRLKGDLEAAPIPGGQPPPMGGQAKRPPALQASNEAVWHGAL